jgi:hypothetical protein
MWMVEPKIMCRKHLLGEHVELHMILGSLRKGISLDGYVAKNCLELRSLKFRHTDIAVEIIARGYNHKSPLDYPDGYSFGQSINVYNSKVNKEKSLQELLRRCADCRKLQEIYKNVA